MAKKCGYNTGNNTRYNTGNNTGAKVVNAPNKAAKAKKPVAVRGKDLRSGK